MEQPLNVPPVTYRGAAPRDNHCLAFVFTALIVDTVLYQVLSWYMEKVFSGTLGLLQLWCFPLLRSYWFPAAAPASAAPANEDHSNEEEGAEQRDSKQLECWKAAWASPCRSASCPRPSGMVSKPCPGKPAR